MKIDIGKWNRGKTVLIALFVILSMVACTNHHLTKQMLFDQMVPEDELNEGKTPVYIPVGNIVASFHVKYRANHLKEILCYNNTGQKVYVSVNENTQLIVTDKNGDVNKFYLDTLFLKG